MQLLDLTLPTPAENIALDEALLQTADAGGEVDETLRIWEPPQPIVVVGRGSSIGSEVNGNTCQADGVPVMRRCSGGASIVAARGCLMYAVVLSYERRPELRMIDRAHHFVLETVAAAIRPLVPDLRQAGISDLAIGDRKVSGNSMRCCRRHLLYHGTLLYDMRLDLVERYLRQPPRQPEYRGGRSHKNFVANLPVDPRVLRESLAEAWRAFQPATSWPRAMTDQLAHEKYTTNAWNQRHP
jgi:lipoate-protein ligase A